MLQVISRNQLCMTTHFVAHSSLSLIQTRYVRRRIEQIQPQHLNAITTLPGSSNRTHGEPAGMRKSHDLACAGLRQEADNTQSGPSLQPVRVA